MRSLLLALFVILFLLVQAFPSPAMEAANAAATPAPAAAPVIAYIDAGINPYHQAFRDPDRTQHPSEYIPGYPANAKPFPITLDVASVQEGLQKDQELWASFDEFQLYYIPGTRIIGVYFTGDYVVEEESRWVRDFYHSDRNGHGTLVADAGSGNSAGVAPDSLIVTVTGGQGDMGASTWISGQRWIDLASISIACWSGVGILPAHLEHKVLGWEPETPSTAPETKKIVDSGRSVFVGGGNDVVSGGTLNIACDIQGPPWTFTVGGLTGNESVGRYEFCDTCSIPVEAAAFWYGCFARVDTVSGCRKAIGTSIASPRMAGYAARLIHEARIALQDIGGSTDAYYAQAAPGVELPATGPLSDGRFDREELEELLRKNANPNYIFDTEWWTDWVMEDLPRPREHDYLIRGYGAVMDDEYQQARSVLLGDLPMPERPEEDVWHTRMKALAHAYWDPWLCRNEAPQDQWDECYTDEYERLLETYLATLPPGIEDQFPRP